MGEACSHLSEEERQVIQIEIGNGTSIRRIGLMLGRNASTVSREIERDTWFPSNENGVLPAVPAETAEDGPVDGQILHRRPRRGARPAAGAPNRASATACHANACGPRVLFPDDSAMRVCPETVYRWIHADRHRRERWARCLPRGHGRRRGRGGGRTSRFPIPGRVPISERPPEAGDRSGFGHWEADGVIGAGCNPHTEVERKTRFLMAGIVPGKTAGESVGAQPAMFSPLPAGARVGVTHDNGTGFARHTRLRDGPGMDTCFADPYSSRRRGSNENRNGMIRRHPPERSEIRMDMAGELREIVDEADNRPMRVLGYRTPAEAFADELLELQDQQGVLHL